jgi:hypothetical protein
VAETATLKRPFDVSASRLLANAASARAASARPGVITLNREKARAVYTEAWNCLDEPNIAYRLVAANTYDRRFMHLHMLWHRPRLARQTPANRSRSFSAYANKQYGPAMPFFNPGKY